MPAISNHRITHRFSSWMLALGMGLLGLLLALPWSPAEAQAYGFAITGRVLDEQSQPVHAAEITLQAAGLSQPLARTETGEDGSWTLRFADASHSSLAILVERIHFEPAEVSLSSSQIVRLREGGAITTGDITLSRHISYAFWAATIIFIGVLLVIALEKLHSTTAALAGMSAVFLVTFIGGAFNRQFFIFDFETALTYINWEVIFLVMGMMIIIAIIERTGIFQWAAFQAYRLSRGRAWLLVLILILLTSVASALLDNFTTMLLMTPISLQIGLALGINPLALIIPEVLASNVGGITTLIGTPTNILIGAYAGIGFQDFLIHQTLGVLLALAALSGFVLFHYKKELGKHGSGLSETLYAKLEENARIRDPNALWKSGLVFLLVLVGFIIGERFHVVPAVPALVGATLLLIWLKPDVHAMIIAVDWTTLVFFMALFIVVGAVQEVGLISMVAGWISAIVGESLVLGIFLIVFGVGTLSTTVANIPLTASMLPVVEFLSGSVPGASSKVLYYALSMGAAMGGNGLLIGAEANLVTAGITSQAGTPISFKEFLKVGLPVTYLTLTAGFLWLLIRFVWLGG
ncbi:MAG: SLC13 family permease [Anaerolineales bacterium]|jgi:Na+/H+ antiporter NhaD/arsenite permease-like protein